MKPGDVVLVKFPFTQLLTTKKRPALVMQVASHSPKIKLLTVAMITSRVEGMRLPGDVVLENWKKPELLHPSLVRLCKMATVDQELIIKTMGRLSPTDLKLIRNSFCKLYAFWSE
jgi:mRNA interferase MazF